MTFFLWLATHCPLSTAHYPLPTAHCPLPSAHSRDQSIAMRGDVIERQAARSLFGPAAAAGDEPGQAAVGGAIGRPEDYAPAIFRSDLGAEDELQATFLGCHVGADDAG